MKSYSHTIKLFLVFFISTIIIFVRGRTAFLYPNLFVEDGYFFSYMLNNHTIDQIGFMYAGYRSIVPNIVIYLSLFSPFLPLSPYLMALFCLFNSAAAFTLFGLRRFRYFIENDDVRLIICLIMVLLPTGDYVLQSNTVYSIWNSFFVLLLLIMLPVSSSKLATIFQTIISLLIIFSHAMVLIIVPFCIYFLFKRPTLRDKIYHATLIAGVGLYMLTSVEPIKSETSFAPMNLGFGVQLVFERVFFEGIFGNILRIELNQHTLYLAMAIGIMIGLSLVGLIYRWRTYLPKSVLEQFFMIGFLIVGMTMMPTISRNLLLQRESLLFDPWSANRYFYVQQLLLILVVLQLGYYRFIKSQILLGSITIKRMAVTTTAIIGLLWIGYLNYKHRPTFFNPPEQSGREVIYFLSSLDKHLHDPAKAAQPIKLDRGVWSITYTGYDSSQKK
ncbi:hypothetical protein [Herpetosiphon gulosus]|uniref:Membrane protein 6-pyruvoyl-tetrahydropterin synthase-related domain-containing protein n=1 Tax=Herpetosiphon gulosus TaxID=1973496 RepID=A0ABP9X361_9CHLR